MQIVIAVTIVFFLLTLAGTWLARRSAYSWADNEKAAAERTGQPGASPPDPRAHTPRPAQRPTPRAQPDPHRIVVTGFDEPNSG